MRIASKLPLAGSSVIQLRPRAQPSLLVSVRGTALGIQSVAFQWERLESAQTEPNGTPTSRGAAYSIPGGLLKAASDLERYFAGRLTRFTAPLDWRDQGSPFDREVWEVLLTIPHGDVWSYAQVARRIGKPGAARAVGGAVGRNPIPLWIPCHRVVGSEGRLTGFSAGLKLKTLLLKVEGACLQEAPLLENWKVSPRKTTLLAAIPSG